MKKKRTPHLRTLEKLFLEYFFQDYMRSNGESPSLPETSFGLFQPSCSSDLLKLTTIKQGHDAYKGKCRTDRIWSIIQSNNSISICRFHATVIVIIFLMLPSLLIN